MSIPEKRENIMVELLAWWRLDFLQYWNIKFGDGYNRGKILAIGIGIVLK